MKSIKQHTPNFKASSVTKPTVATQVSEKQKFKMQPLDVSYVPERQLNKFGSHSRWQRSNPPPPPQDLC